MSSAKKYRVAVVGGAGTWGRCYLRAFANEPNCEVVALVDRARDRRQAFADRYGIKTVFDTVDELLDREVPDIVSAILPVAQAYDAVTACARSGVKVVSCEKPIAFELAKADEMLRTCWNHGTVFCCGSVYSGIGYLRETIDWLREGNIGELTAAAIPGSLPHEVAGGGCVQLTILRLVSGMEVKWVEGWDLRPESGWTGPLGAQEAEIDSPAYGRLGLSGGIICDIPAPRTDRDIPCRVALSGEDGHCWIGSRPVFIQGRNARSSPVYPAFLQTPLPDDYFVPVVKRLVRAVGTGIDPLSSAHGYRHALEVAIALKQSAERGHQRVELPLEDRSARIFPHPYRLDGGDVAGWKSIGYKGPPEVV